MEGFIANLDTFFDTVAVDARTGFEWQGWTCRIIQQIHIMSGSSVFPTYGLLMSKPGKKTVYFTTDSQHCSPAQVEVFYKEADIIFQDCETSPFLSNVHANYIQLAGHDDANCRKLSNDIKMKMRLSHYQDFVTAGKKQVVKNSPYEFYRASEESKDFVSMIPHNWEESAALDGFWGFVKVGDEFEV